MRFSKTTKITLLPFYPFLLAIYPVLYLWSSNRAQQPAYVIIPSLLVTLAGAVIVYLLALALARNAHRAALLAAILAFFLLTFGHFANLVHQISPNLEPASLLPAALFLTCALLALALIRRLGSPALTKTMNVVTLALVLMQVIPAAPYYLAMARMNKASALASPLHRSIPLTSRIPRRDVYFILLDNYGRQDILLEGSDFDNSQLINALKERGFVFPDCAQGNYMWTAPAITSILNMDYLDQLGVPESAFIKRGGYEQMAPLIQDSLVLQKFKNYGYHTVTFRGFMGLIDIQDADTYINFEKDTDYTQRLETAKFQDLYWKTTLLSAADSTFHISARIMPSEGSPDPEDLLLSASEALEPQFYQVYQQNIYAFDALERIPTEIGSPKFVYAHIYSAHWPFMFQPDGSLRLPFTKEQTVPGYVDGVRYTNSRILDAIDAILEHSDPDPIIILQGDHSNEWTRPVEWSGQDRLKILSAYYLPDDGGELLYDQISPVNNFRLIFRYYFGEPLTLLPDRHYYKDPRTKTMRPAPVTCMSDPDEITLPRN